ncbi:hypothetical protein BLNAU_24941 [Blattamonas nauphoetae]|uniref:Uncharacterized protein n=1 Tax=Blattamonas nauphoetae TaxID=2049346 RepID=A0ABQ9WL09_9EUKA|nr:hypothetical protein BLNAU_24941 [Blattamonas nauphoetae]
MIVNRRDYEMTDEDRKTIGRTVPNFLEEGWQDAVEFIFIQGKDVDHFDTKFSARLMMKFFGTNLNRVPKSRLFHQISFRTVVFKVAHYAVLNVGFSV